MHVPRVLRHEVVRCAETVEQPRRQRAADEHTQHRLPACHTRRQQQQRTQQDSPQAGLADRTRDQTVGHVPEISRHRRTRSQLRQRSSARETVHQTAVPAPRSTVANEDLVAGHRTRVRKEQERTRDKRYVEDVISRAAEHLFGEDNRESHSYRYLPQRRVNRHDQRDDKSCYQKSFCHFLMLDLRYDELDAQTYCVRHDDVRQHGQQTEAERFPEQRASQTGCQLARCQQVLVTDVEHTEEHRRNKRHHHEDHRTFAVRTVVDMGAVAFRRRLRSEQERIEGVIERAQLSELTAFFEVLTELLPNLI